LPLARTRDNFSPPPAGVDMAKLKAAAERRRICGILGILAGDFRLFLRAAPVAAAARRRTLWAAALRSENGPQAHPFCARFRLGETAAVRSTTRRGSAVRTCGPACHALGPHACLPAAAYACLPPACATRRSSRCRARIRTAPSGGGSFGFHALLRTALLTVPALSIAWKSCARCLC